ncbi:MAG: hypothetical protein K2H87_08250, partial [Duncaniella sp.]|nr:hypothetical protein [Duncaniella sp.]
YVLLRKPQLGTKEVIDRLFRLININSLYRKMKDCIYPVCDKYLSIDRIKKPNGKIVNELPEWLNPSLVKEIVNEYKEYIEDTYRPENFLPAIIAQIERLTWLQGVDDMETGLKEFIELIERTAKTYADIPVSTPEEHDLQEKYEAAHRITVKERIMSDNREDVLAFRGALLTYAQNLCETHIYRQLAHLYSELANSEELKSLIAKYGQIHHEAVNERATLSLPTHPADWDTEYEHLFPIEFFERNIERIDAAMAFQMILIQSIARHEEWFKQHGALTDDGRVTLFTGTFPLMEIPLAKVIL